MMDLSLGFELDLIEGKLNRSPPNQGRKSPIQGQSAGKTEAKEEYRGAVGEKKESTSPKEEELKHLIEAATA